MELPFELATAGARFSDGGVDCFVLSPAASDTVVIAIPERKSLRFTGAPVMRNETEKDTTAKPVHCRGKKTAPAREEAGAA
jgi:hypothetical protein